LILRGSYFILRELFQASNAHRSLVEHSRNFNFGFTIQPIDEVWHGRGTTLYALQLRITNNGQLKQDTIVYNLINQSTVKVSRRSISSKM